MSDKWVEIGVIGETDAFVANNVSADGDDVRGRAHVRDDADRVHDVDYDHDRLQDVDGIAHVNASDADGNAHGVDDVVAKQRLDWIMTFCSKSLCKNVWRNKWKMK